MSYITNTNTELLFAGPQSNWPAAAAASASAQSLTATASGDAVQPYIPAFWWTYGRSNQALKLRGYGIVSGQSSATTATWAFGVTSTGGGVITGTLNALLTTAAQTVTSLSNVNWMVDLDIITRNVGWGTTSVSTQVLAFGTFTLMLATPIVFVIGPTTVSVIDNSVNQYIYGSVTFSTSSASNSCTWELAKLYGEN